MAPSVQSVPIPPGINLSSRTHNVQVFLWWGICYERSTLGSGICFVLFNLLFSTTFENDNFCLNIKSKQVYPVYRQPLPSEEIGERDFCKSPSLIIFPFPWNVEESLWLVVMLMLWCKQFLALWLVNGSWNRFPGENLSLCGQLTTFYFFTCISALWNGHVK